VSDPWRRTFASSLSRWCSLPYAVAVAHSGSVRRVHHPTSPTLPHEENLHFLRTPGSQCAAPRGTPSVFSVHERGLRIGVIKIPGLDSFDRLEKDVIRCRLCPRLVEWRQEAAELKPRRFQNWTYWARPLPGFGVQTARGLLIVGLAPAAHGGNRTGRVFTGDESGNWLFRAMHDAGFASQAESTHRDDGLALIGARVTAAVRCAPPANRPLPAEEANCRSFLVRELELADPRVIVCLGGFAWSAVLRVLRDRGSAVPRPLPRFGHGAQAEIDDGKVTLLASYHPSQQNTFTGKLTAPMLRRIFVHAKRVLNR
jgi:uracil-DNA glycosylase